MVMLQQHADGKGLRRGKLRRPNLREGFGKIWIVLALIAVTLWGGNFAVLKIAANSWPPLFFTGTRFLLVALISVPFLGALPAERRALLGVSVTMGLLHFVGLIYGIKHISPTAASLIYQLNVPLGIVLAAVIYREKISLRIAVGLAVSLVGAVLVGGEIGWTSREGTLLMLLAAAAFAVGQMQVRQLEHLNAFRLNGWVSLLSAPQFLLLSYLFEQNQMQTALSARLEDWLCLLYVSLLSGFLAYGLWYMACKRASSAEVLPFNLLAPAIGVYFTLVLLGEIPSPLLLIAGATILGGICIILYGRRAEHIQTVPEAPSSLALDQSAQGSGR